MQKRMIMYVSANAMFSVSDYGVILTSLLNYVTWFFFSLNLYQLWNASQLEMVHHGKMHGFMR
jgi:hypothetical protein